MEGTIGFISITLNLNPWKINDRGRSSIRNMIISISFEVKRSHFHG
jgi:hypothetical protein